MSSHRLIQLEELFQNQIGVFLNRELGEKLGFLTVSRVKLSPDLKTGKVCVRTFPAKLSESIIKAHILPLIRELAGHLKTKVKLKYFPELTFYPDCEADEIQKVQELIDDLEK